MARNFFHMVNSVRQMLREKSLDSAFDTGELTTVVKSFLNDAMREVIDGQPDHTWSFLFKDNEQLFFPGRYDSGSTLFLGNGSAVGFFQDATATNTARWASPRKTCMLVTSDTTFPDHSYHLVNTSTAPANAFSLLSKYRGVGQTGTGTFSLYCSEIVLAPTVGQVLSVRNENDPLRLEFIEKHLQFDERVPRTTDQFRDRPEVVIVGGNSLASTVDAATADKGAGLMIWPPPSSDLVLKYSYVFRHVDLVTEANEWNAVPDAVLRLIEYVAFQKALMTNIEDDPRRGQMLKRDNEIRLARLKGADRPAMTRRRIPRAFGSTRSGSVNPRWDDQEVPTP